MTHKQVGFGRGGVLLFLGYLALFLILHVPLPDGALGILAALPGNYLVQTSYLNPIQWLNEHLGRYASLAVRFELLLVFGLLCLTYYLTLRSVKHSRSGSLRLRSVLGGTLLFSLPLLLLPYQLSHDVHAYIMQGRIVAIYGANPALVLPAAYPHDPFLPYLWAEGTTGGRFEVGLYGPMWILLSQGLTLVVEQIQSSLWLYLLVYKLVSMVALLVSTCLLWSILGRWKPAQQGWGTLLFAWNPLILLEWSGSGHNDAVMVMLILLAIWLAQGNRWRSAIAVLVAATLVKWMPIFLLSFYALVLLRRTAPWQARVILASQIGLVTFATALLLYAPYGLDRQALGTIIRIPAMKQGEINNSLYTLPAKGMPYLLERLGVQLDTAQLQQSVIDTLMWFRRGVLGLAWLLTLAAIWRRPTWAAFVTYSCRFFLVLLLFATSWFWSWYVTWPLALAALVEWGVTSKVAIAFSSTALLLYVAYPIHPLGPFEAIRSVYIFVPVYGLLGYLLWQRWSHPPYHKKHFLAWLGTSYSRLTIGRRTA